MVRGGSASVRDLVRTVDRSYRPTSLCPTASCPTTGPPSRPTTRRLAAGSQLPPSRPPISDLIGGRFLCRAKAHHSRPLASSLISVRVPHGGCGHGVIPGTAGARARTTVQADHHLSLGTTPIHLRVNRSCLRGRRLHRHDLGPMVWCVRLAYGQESLKMGQGRSRGTSAMLLPGCARGVPGRSRQRSATETGLPGVVS